MKSYIRVISQILAITLAVFLLVTLWFRFNIREEYRKLSEISVITVVGQADVFLEKADSSYIMVKSDEKYIPSVRTEIKNDSLIIQTKGKIRGERVLEVYVYSRSLPSRIYGSGSGKFYIGTGFSQDSLSITTSGAMDFYVRGDYRILQIHQIAASNMYLSGKTEEGFIKIDGVGDLVGYNMVFKKATIDIENISESKEIVRISVSDTLWALIRGNCYIYVKRNPVIQESITGSGRVIKK